MSDPPSVPSQDKDGLAVSEDVISLPFASPRPEVVDQHHPTSIPSAPAFLATLSPHKSAALTETFKSLAVAQGSHSSSKTNSPLISPSLSSHDGNTKSSLSGCRLMEDLEAVNETLLLHDSNQERPGKLSLRLGSAMDTSLGVTDLPSADPGRVDPSEKKANLPALGGTKSRSGSISDLEQDASHQTIDPMVTAPSNEDNEYDSRSASIQLSKAQGEPSKGTAWTSWTSRAASGSLSILKQSTATAAGWSSVLAANPFRGPSFAGDPEATTSSRLEAGPSRHCANTDSDDDDAMMAKSAADALRSKAKDEEKRRAAQARIRQKEGREKSRAAEKNTQSGKERGRPQQAPPQLPTHMTQETGSSSGSRSSSPTVPGVNIFDYCESWPGACDQPTDNLLPERRYFVLTQAGKPVFLSHLAARRMEREDAARLRLKALRQGKRLREEQRRALSSEAVMHAEALLGFKQADDEADAKEDEARTRDRVASDEEEEEGAIQVGVIQALISNYLEQGQAILESKSIDVLHLPKLSSRVVFLARAPLYLAVTSTWHDGGQIYADLATILKAHLEVLHAGLISLISESQLKGLFARGYNFDLRRMLEGTDGILSSLVARCQSDFGLILGAGGGGGICLRPTRLDLKLREDLGSCLSLERWENRPLSRVLAADSGRLNPSSTSATPKGGAQSSHTSPSTPELDPSNLKLEFKVPARPKDLLYILLITSDGQLITMLRPRRLSAYPLDLHLLMNTIVGMSRRTQREPGTVNWIPICLPRFAPQGMVQAHISWLHGESRQRQSRSDEGEEKGNADAEERGGRKKAECALVIVTADRESFDEIGVWRDGVVSALNLPPSPLASLSRALTHAPLSADSLRLPGLRHFVLKKKDDLQIVWSEWIEPYSGDGIEASLAKDRVRKAYARARELSVLGARMSKGGRKVRKMKQTVPIEVNGKESKKSSSARSSKPTECPAQETGEAGSSALKSQVDPTMIEGTSLAPPREGLSTVVMSAEASTRTEESEAAMMAQPDALLPQANLTSHYFRTPYEAFYIEVPPVGSVASSLTGPLIAEVDSASPYEVYLTLSPNVPPGTARKIARQVVRWGLGSGGVSGIGGAGEAIAGERWRLFVSGRGMVF